MNEASEVEWGEEKCIIVMGEGEVFMEKVYTNSKWWEVKDWGESVSELVIGVGETITRNCTQYCPTWVFLPFVHVKSLICLMCIVDSFKLSCV